MKTVAIIQARIGSVRLPGKVLMDIEGKSMLQRVVERTKQAKLIDQTILTIPETQQNQNLKGFAINHAISYYPGSETDVLDRFYQTALKHARGETIIRITGDCPLIDPDIIDRGIRVFDAGDYDYVDNANNPDGMDTEVFSFDVLREAWKDATSPYDREHVTSYIVNHPDIFRIGKIMTEDYTGLYWWSVNILADLEFVRRVYQELGEDFHLEDVIKLVEEK